MSKPQTNFDVVIVGGGPAGLAAAIAARQRGLSVALVDAARPPVDKACGEGIMPDGLAALENLGVSLPVESAAQFRGIRFVHQGQTVEADFGGGHGVAMRRPLLHSALIEHATNVGVSQHWETRVIGRTNTALVTTAGEIRGRFLIGADGLNSVVRRSSGLDEGKIVRRRFGFRRHYAIESWSRFVEVHWGDCGQMYVTPVGPGEICIALITEDPHLRFDEALRHFPFLNKKLGSLEPTTATRGSLTLTRRFHRVCTDEVALIGDASGSADAITGDGMSMSFRQAAVLADAMAAGSLASYRAAHRKICRLPIFMGELMLTMADHPSFRRRVFQVFEKHPDYFRRLLGIHTGTVSPASFVLGDSLSLGWHLLTV